MAISTTTIKHTYNGNGVTTSFPYTFPISTTDGSDIKVYLTTPAGVTTLQETNYTVNVAGGTVTYPTVGSPLASGWKITLIRAENLTQLLDLITQGSFNADNIEDAFDKLTMITQQIDEEVGRCPKFPVDQTPSSEDTDDFISTVTDLKDDAETAKTAAQVSQAAASASASSASTSATNASNSASAAASSASSASTSASTATTQASNASTSATNAASSASSASTSASTATTQASNASTSATNAANSASAASTSASNAAASETVAANYAAGLKGTSITSLAIGTGSKTFTTQSGKQFAAGQYVLASSDADPTNYMHGQVTSYSGTTLIVNVTNTGGSGTLADWTIHVSGTRGAQGAGDMQYSDTRYEVVSFSRDTSLASGTQNVTLVTQKTPKAFIFFMAQDGVDNEISWGLDDKTTAICMRRNGTVAWNISGTTSINDIHTSGSADYVGKITATAVGQFTVTWEKNGSPIGTITVLALVVF